MRRDEGATDCLRRGRVCSTDRGDAADMVTVAGEVWTSASDDPRRRKAPLLPRRA